MRSTLSFVLVFVACIATGCGKNTPPSQEMPKTVIGIDETSNEPRFTFKAPDGFVWNEEHKLFYYKELRTSITMAHAPEQSLEFVIEDFSTDRMLSANMELLEKDVREVNDRKTLLVKGNRLNAPYPQQFCTVAYRTDNGCAQLTVIYPTDLSVEVKSELESALLNSTYGVPN